MHKIARVVVVAAVFICMLPEAHSASPCTPTETEFAFRQTAAGPLKVHVFSPPHHIKTPRPAIVIFHGGGWTMGDPSWAFGLVNRYACKGLVTIVAQYRLSDKKTATPADAVDDAMAAIRWVRTNATTLGLDPDRVAALGWSAGAHLAASAAIFAKDDDQRPSLLALVSPAVSVVDDGHFSSLFPLGTKTENFSPAEHVGPSLPPTIIVTGRDDTVTPLRAVKKFHERMKAAGNVSELHVYDDVGHMFTPKGQSDSGFPNPDKAVRQRAYEAIDEFLIRQAYMAR
ncbi:alpha/beta hydrolase [Massilia oculi]|uniref:Alpha/beta hydrolase n=1 Tax=Massilia hydrophila TaxID=3044279 RepID=A0ABS7Y631_9BURK|nr:alpha/beta hydrolase [Massilia oculi]MCA1855119.1 alpha/beta hydrolase [Massilia oculi]